MFAWYYLGNRTINNSGIFIICIYCGLRFRVSDSDTGKLLEEGRMANGRERAEVVSAAGLGLLSVGVELTGSVPLGPPTFVTLTLSEIFRLTSCGAVFVPFI